MSKAAAVSRGFSLSVVLPAYNEEQALPDTLQEILNYFDRRKVEGEIVVVDDGSCDRTAEVVREWQQRDSRVRLLQHQKNRGYGEALRTGFDGARKEWVLLMDADGQFDINDLDAFLAQTPQADFLVGFRAQRADAWTRDFLTRGYSWLVNFLYGLKVRDIDCAFKLWRRRFWKEIEPRWARDHKIFTVEWLIRARRAGLRWRELPVRHLPRRGGIATGARWHVIAAMLAALLQEGPRLWLLRWRKK
jgi:glycosyltransferase involved in cell wall biosynthesis